MGGGGCFCLASATDTKPDNAVARGERRGESNPRHLTGSGEDGYWVILACAEPMPVAVMQWWDKNCHTNVENVPRIIRYFWHGKMSNKQYVKYRQLNRTVSQDKNMLLMQCSAVLIICLHICYMFTRLCIGQMSHNEATWNWHILRGPNAIIKQNK